MKFLQLNGVEILSKSTQQQIKGGTPYEPANCSHLAQGACMSACGASGNYSSQACYDDCFGKDNGCN